MKTKRESSTPAAPTPGSSCTGSSSPPQTPAETTSLFLTCRTEGRGRFLNITNAHWNHTISITTSAPSAGAVLRGCLEAERQPLFPRPPHCSNPCAWTCLPQRQKQPPDSLIWSAATAMKSCPSYDTSKRPQPRIFVSGRGGRQSRSRTPPGSCEPPHVTQRVRLTQCLSDPRPR